MIITNIISLVTNSWIYIIEPRLVNFTNEFDEQLVGCAYSESPKDALSLSCPVWSRPFLAEHKTDVNQNFEDFAVNLFKN